MVSTRQSCSSAAGVDHSVTDSGGSCGGSVKTRQSANNNSTHQHNPPPQPQPPPLPALGQHWHDPALAPPPNYPSKVHFLDLPQEIFDKIFSYIGYKSVSQLRLVCRQLDRISSSILNSTFQRLQTQMLQRFQGIKSKMPRRESARRNHPLACESDIIETLHMRLTLLQMSFGKHIERKHCCFFAGEILDEVYRILHYIKVTPKLARPYRVTDELFDLSTMAMEYFKERIEPTLPEISYFGTDFLDFTSGLPTTTNKTWMLDSPPHTSVKTEYESPGSNDERPIETTSPQPQSNTVLRKRISKIKQGMKKYNSQLTLMKRELRTCKNKLADQQKQFLEFASRMDEHDKKNEESSRKFSTLLQELNKCKTELQYWRSKFPHSSLCVSCGKVISGNGGNGGGGSLPTEELPSRSSTSFSGHQIAAMPGSLEDPQPSTSSSLAIPSAVEVADLVQSQTSTQSSTAQVSSYTEDKDAHHHHEETAGAALRANHQPTKRKSAVYSEDALSAPIYSKKTKKTVLKLRSKRS
ncbi:hypothetical protein AAG570_010248 [Ranatra chinensis]|uniref:F-box domain-containing protein n=1 Tax=Ranatra chinensis TaxID=642074 RepID=A0ABD0YMD9_9HEMI